MLDRWRHRLNIHAQTCSYLTGTSLTFTLIPEITVSFPISSRIYRIFVATQFAFVIYLTHIRTWGWKHCLHIKSSHNKTVVSLRSQFILALFLWLIERPDCILDKISFCRLWFSLPVCLCSVDLLCIWCTFCL